MWDLGSGICQGDRGGAAVGGPVGLVHHHLPASTENRVHCDLSMSVLKEMHQQQLQDL